MDTCRQCADPLWTTRCNDCDRGKVRDEKTNTEQPCPICRGGGRVCGSCGTGSY